MKSHQQSSISGSPLSPWYIAVVAAVLFAGRVWVLAEPRTAAPPFNDQASGELLVKWKDGPASPNAAVANARIGSTVKRNFNALGWQHVVLPPGMSVSEGLAAYRTLEDVLAVEPNRTIPIEPPHPLAPWPSRSVSLHATTPNDPQYGSQWHLKKIGAPAAWDTATGSTNVVVAIMDSGMDYTHPDLAPNLWRNPGETGLDADGHDKATNGIDDDGDGYVDDVHGVDVVTGTGNPMDMGIGAPSPFYHGTFIAGIIGAAGNNHLGIAGVNWSVQLLSVRFIATDQDVTAIPVVVSRALAGMDYLVGLKRRGVNLRVVNHSWGGNADSIAVRDALDLAGQEGIVSVFAAMNQSVSSDLYSVFPGADNAAAVINVAASTESDTLAGFSDFGASTVDLAAPGVNILSTTKGGGYGNGEGTSFACPQVVGAAALLLSVRPNLTLDELKAALLGSVDHPAGLKGKVLTGGRLNVARALAYLTNSDPPAIVLRAAPAGQWSTTNAPLQVTFNRGMDRASVEGAMIITPPAVGTFEWTPDNRSFVYHHEVPFDPTTDYTVRISGSAQDATGGSLDGNFNQALEGAPGDDFVWTFRFRTANDDFAAAQSLVEAAGSIAGNNRYAWLEAEEPFHAGRPEMAASVWYRWRAPRSTGWWTFDLTRGTAFDSILAAYTGDRLDGLASVAANDDYGSVLASRISFNATEGMEYSLVVASKDLLEPSKEGPFTLTWYPTPPPGFTGAQFSPRTALPGTKVTFTGTNFTGATAVLFNGASATFTNATGSNLDLRLTALVPPDATSGAITIITPHGSVTSTAMFQVLPPRLSVARTASGNVEIRWPATGSTMVLEASDDLAAANWTAVAEDPVRADGQSRVTVVPLVSPRFYRLQSN